MNIRLFTITKKDQSNGCKFPNEAETKNQEYTYLYIQAPPATVFLQDPQCQIPTALLFILVCNFSKCNEITRTNVPCQYYSNFNKCPFIKQNFITAIGFLTLPQNEQVYLECWEISIFFTIFLSDAP